MAKGEDITTKFKVDISDLKKGITEANNQIKLANSEFKKASSGMDDWSSSSEGVKAKLTQLKSVLEAQTSKLQSYQKQLQSAKQYEKEAADNVTQLKSALEKAKQEYGENSTEVKVLEQQLSKAEQQYQQMHTQVTKLTTTMNNQEAAVNSTEKEIKDLTNQLDKVEQAEKEAAKSGKDVNQVLDEMDSSASNAGNGFTVLKGAMASLVADGIRMAIQAVKEFVAETVEVGSSFDSAMSQVQAVSGATTTQLEALRDKAKEMGANTKFSATEAADAFNYMAMAGWKTEDMLNGIDGVLALAAASNTDLATTSDIVTDALTAMGYSAGDAGRLADVMAAAASNANTTVEGMGATFKYAAPIAGALGYSMEDLAVATGLMANAGIKGEQAGTSLRSVMTRLSAPPSEAAKAMDELGISITNADGTMKPFSEVLEILRGKFDGLSESEQTQYAKAIAGQEAMSGLLAIVNASPADFDKLTGAINNSNGAAEEMASVMQDNLGGDMTELGSKVEGLQIALYENFEPALRFVVQALQKFTDAISWCVENVPGFVPIISAVATALGVLAGALAIDAIIGMVSTAMTALSGAMLGLAANPITLVIAAIAGIVVAFTMLWNKSEAFRNFFIGIWDAIKDAVGKAIEWVKNTLDSLGENFEHLKKYILIRLYELRDKMSDVIDSIKEFISSLKDFISKVWEKIKDIFKTVLQTIKDIISKFIEEVKKFWNKWGDDILKIVKNAFDYISDAIKLALDVIKGVFDTFSAVFKGDWEGAWESVKKLVETVWNGIKDLIKDQLELIKSIVDLGVNIVKDTVSNVFNAVKSKVSEIWNGIKKSISDSIQNAKDKVSDTVNGIKNKVKDTFDTVKSNVTNAWNSIKKAITDPIQSAKETVSEVVESIKSKVKNIFNGIKPKLSLSLPTVTVDGGKAPWGIAGKGTLPSFHVKWNRLGGVFDSPTIFGGSKGFQGLGEDGAEAVVPLERNKYWIKSVAKDMLDALGLSDVKSTARSAITNNSNVNNFTQVINAPKSPSRIELYRDAKNLLALKGG